MKYIFKNLSLCAYLEQVLLKKQRQSKAIKYSPWNQVGSRVATVFGTALAELHLKERNLVVHLAKVRCLVFWLVKAASGENTFVTNWKELN